jgi:preprotein translocase subunit SecB
MMDPVDFQALYVQNMRNLQAQSATNAVPPTTN